MKANRYIVIAGMGFEMLYGGGASKAQGEDEREEYDEDELLNESFGESPPSDKSKQTKKKAVGTLMKPGRGGARGKGRS